MTYMYDITVPIAWHPSITDHSPQVAKSGQACKCTRTSM